MNHTLKKIEDAFESSHAHKILAGLIIFYVFVLCLETSKAFPEEYNMIFKTIDAYICGVFVIELICKICISGFKFFKNGWNIFDFIVVFTSVLAVNEIAAFRILRIFRVAEIINISKHTRVIVNSILKSVPILSHVFAALVMVFLLFAILAIDLFGETTPQLFGNLSESSYNLMLILIGDGVLDLIRAVEPNHPYGYIFFVSYIIVMSCIILNLLFGVIISSLQKAIDEEEKNERKTQMKSRKHTLDA